VDLRDYLDILRARWKLITITTLLGVAAAAIASMLTTPLYQSCTVQFVSAADGQSSLSTAYTGSLFTQQRVKSYVEGVTSTPVMQGVVDDLGLPLTSQQVAAKVDVNNPLDTVNLEICATDANPELAQRIATTTANQFRAYVAEIEVPDATTGQALVKMEQFEAAPLPTSPVSPRTKINLALGFLVGLAVGVGAAVLLETLDTRIKSIEVLAKYFEQTLLGVIGYDPEAPKKPLIVQDSPQSKRAESFRQVRTNLQFVDIDHRPKSIVVTSSIPREGKSTTAINLAITIAQTGQPVFLIEGDLRRPKIADYLGIEGNAGLTDVLVGRATIDEVMQPWGATGNLWVLPAGQLPPNPSELLGSQAMADLVHHLERRATLIIDAPPLLPVTDAAVLSQLAGGAIVIIATGKARREQLRTAVNSIEGVGGKILGLVMNMAPAKGPDSHRYGYGYSYDYQTITTRGKLDHDAPVIPAGLGEAPRVNGSATSAESATPSGDGAKPDTVTAASTPTAMPPAVAVSAARSTEKAPTPTAAPPTTATRVTSSTAPLKPPRKRKSDAATSAVVTPDAKDAPPSVLVDRALGRGAGNGDPALAAPLTDAIEVQPASGQSAPQQPALQQVVPSEDKVIGHSLKVPLPEPVIDDPPMAYEPDADPVGDWTPPKPRPAFDPLTAPLDEIRQD